MKRRDFLKRTGLFIGGAAMAGCNFGCNQCINSNKDDNYLPHVEFMISHHCNLNCAYCDHFSPLADEYFYPLDKFKKDIKRLYSLTNAKLKKIELLGGEPLLNKNIEKYIKIARKYFNDTFIVIETNGILLNQMNDSFWKTCADNKIKIQYSYYPLYKNYPNLEKAHLKAQKFNVKFASSNPRSEFGLMHLDNKRDRNIEKAYKNCNSKIVCAVLNNGILYPCQVMAGVDMFFNKKFKNYAIPVAKDDYIDIFKIKSLDEILEFYKKPKEFCRYCGFSFTGKEKIPYGRKPWKKSNQDISEWYDINSK